LLRLRARTGFPLTLHSNRFRPDRMNGSGTPRFGAPSITESDFCNRREARAHPRATRLPARRRVQRRRLAIEGRGRQSTGYPAGSRAPALPIALTRPSFGTRRERPARIEADTLVGQRNGRKPGEAPARSVPRGPPSTCRANGEAVERTRVPSRRSEPRLFTAALRRLQRSPTKTSIFHAYEGGALDGAHRRARGREAVSEAQHATETIFLRRPNDVLRNVSPASKCAKKKKKGLINKPTK
jgi:hypothetical protein